jgi:hypothetical protein
MECPKHVTKTGHLETFLGPSDLFFYRWSQRPFDPSPPLLEPQDLFVHRFIFNLLNCRLRSMGPPDPLHLTRCRTCFSVTHYEGILYSKVRYFLHVKALTNARLFFLDRTDFRISATSRWCSEPTSAPRLFLTSRNDSLTDANVVNLVQRPLFHSHPHSYLFRPKFRKIATVSACTKFG